MNQARKIDMSNIVFDTLQFAKRAEAAGFTKEQAEFQAEEMASIIETEIATKRDLEEVANKLIIKFGAMLVVAVGIIIGFMKL